MMKRIAIVIVALILVVSAIPIVQNGLRYKMKPLEALFVPLFDGTAWSPSYSFKKFRSITPGMSTTEVSRVLGPCLVQTVHEEQPSWHYTMGRDGRVMSSSEHSTHQRIVHFDANGIVTHTTYDFYFD